MFPSDSVLIARGKYSTLGKERRDLLRRVQSACSLMMNQASEIMRDAEKAIPLNPDHLDAAKACLVQAEEARDELVKVCKQMDELKDEAWGNKEPETA